MSNSKLHPRSTARIVRRATPRTKAALRPPLEDPKDALAQAWIAALTRRRLEASRADHDPHAADDWIIETLIKLGFAAPERAYEVGVRIVALSEDPWIIETVGVGVFANLLRRHGPLLAGRLAHDVDQLPRLGRALVHASPMALAI
ncbi:MAG: hypothetical protein P4L73_03135 [Caulobacteraceae bacterium]|nr:hypothetical protein [Caulobacteraceae bacterium]